MAKPFLFHEFENVSATVQGNTESLDDMMGLSDSFATKTTVGSSGVIVGSLQSLGGQRQDDLSGRIGSVVNFIFHVDNTTVGVSLIANGDRLVINSVKYDVVHTEDETGATLAPVVYLIKTT